MLDTSVKFCEWPNEVIVTAFAPSEVSGETVNGSVVVPWPTPPA